MMAAAKDGTKSENQATTPDAASDPAPPGKDAAKVLTEPEAQEPTGPGAYEIDPSAAGEEQDATEDPGIHIAMVDVDPVVGLLTEIRDLLKAKK